MPESLCILIHCHLSESVSIELLSISLDCLLRIAYALKESRIVLDIDWLKMWSCLMKLVKFIAVNHEALIAKSFCMIMTVSMLMF